MKKLLILLRYVLDPEHNEECASFIMICVSFSGCEQVFDQNLLIPGVVFGKKIVSSIKIG